MIVDPGATTSTDDASHNDTLRTAAAASRQERAATLHALHALEYALAAPAPRRQRTWVHRVAAAIDVLNDTLDQQTTSRKGPQLLSVLGARDPVRELAIGRLRQEHDNIRIAATALREQIELGPAVFVDVAGIRARLATLTRRYRQHNAREADLVYELAGLDLTTDNEPAPQPRTIANQDARGHSGQAETNEKPRLNPTPEREPNHINRGRGQSVADC